MTSTKLLPDDVLIALERQIQAIQAYATGFWALEVAPFLAPDSDGEPDTSDHLAHANQKRADHGKATHVEILMEAAKLSHRVIGIRPTTVKGLAVKARLLLDGRMPASWQGEPADLVHGDRLALALIHDVIRVAETQRPAPPPRG
jgi:hypothetical protein